MTEGAAFRGRVEKNYIPSTYSVLSSCRISFILWSKRALPGAQLEVSHLQLVIYLFLCLTFQISWP